MNNQLEEALNELEQNVKFYHEDFTDEQLKRIELIHKVIGWRILGELSEFKVNFLLEPNIDFDIADWYTICIKFKLWRVENRDRDIDWRDGQKAFGLILQEVMDKGEEHLTFSKIYYSSKNLLFKFRDK